jgi:hypothetical protein
MLRMRHACVASVWIGAVTLITIANQRSAGDPPPVTNPKAQPPIYDNQDCINQWPCQGTNGCWPFIVGGLGAIECDMTQNPFIIYECQGPALTTCPAPGQGYVARSCIGTTRQPDGKCTGAIIPNNNCVMNWWSCK